MGTTCSVVSRQRKVKESKDGSEVTLLSGTTCSEEPSLEPVDNFPRDLVVMLLQPTGHRNLAPGKLRFVRHVVGQPNLVDTEVLALYSVLSRVMDHDTCLRAARSLNDRGFPSEAMSCLRYFPTSDEVQTLVAEIQQSRLERWSRTDVEIVEYTSFWESSDLDRALDRCEEALIAKLQELSQSVPDKATKFGVKGMVDDTPSPESQDLHWSKEGNLNAIEQEKTMSMWMKHTLTKVHPRMDDIYRYPQHRSGVLSPRLHTKMTCKITGVRFIKVEALLAMEKLVSFEYLPSEAFTDEGHFAVSHRRGDDTILMRLQKVLKSVDGILPSDGVFIDCCCAPPTDPLTTLFAKAIYEQCHVIFLPSADFFTRAWCTFECMAWLLSPFPTQALGDFDLGRCITLMCVYHFGRPPYCLDRPELQMLGRIVMSTTEIGTSKEFLTWTLGENRIKSTGLWESLTKLVFKMESTITV